MEKYVGGLIEPLKKWDKVVLLLAPGFYGKSTLAMNLKERLGDRLSLFIAGDVVKKEAISGSKLGLKLGKVMSKYKLLPNRLLINLLRDKLYDVRHQTGQVFLLEGFPRSLESLKYMSHSLKLIKHKVLIVYFAELPKEEFELRIKQERTICVSCGAIFLYNKCLTCGSTESKVRVTDEPLAWQRRREESMLFRSKLWKKFIKGYTNLRLDSLSLEKNLETVIKELS